LVSLSAPVRFKIVGVEVVGLGVYNILVLLLQLRESHGQDFVLGFGWDYAIIGAVLIAVGLELLSLIRHLPGQRVPGEIPTSSDAPKSA